jgi:hypothetical protein
LYILINLIVRLNALANQLSTQQVNRWAQWNQEFGTDFVSHGIGKNIEAVLTDRRVRCGENILRRNQRLEFEGGSTCGAREIVAFPDNTQNEEFLKDIEEIKEIILKAFNYTDADIEKTLRILDIHTKAEKQFPRESNDLDFWENVKKQDELIDILKKPLSQMAGNCIDGLRQIQSAYENFLRCIIEEYPQIWSKNKSPRDLYAVPILAIYIDQSFPKEKRFKALLKRIYTIYEKLLDKKEIDLQSTDLQDFFYDLRKAWLADPYKINSTIRVDRNSIGRYGYGSVKILVGGTDKIIGSKQQEETGEHYLLNTLQNKGKFFKIDLAAKNILIIGPEKELSKFSDNPHFGQNIVFTENMPKSDF